MHFIPTNYEVYSLLNSLLPKGGSIVDIGTGNGQFIIPFLNKGYDLTVTDIKSDTEMEHPLSTQIANVAHGTAEFRGLISEVITWVKGITIVNKDGEGELFRFLNNKKDRYDLIILSQVLHFVPKADRVRAKEFLANSLKDNGYLFLRVNHVNNKSITEGAGVAQIEKDGYSDGVLTYFLFREEEIKNFHPQLKTVKVAYNHPEYFTTILQKFPRSK